MFFVMHNIRKDDNNNKIIEGKQVDIGKLKDGPMHGRPKKSMLDRIVAGGKHRYSFVY